jgi:hypothetical protein
MGNADYRRVFLLTVDAFVFPLMFTISAPLSLLVILRVCLASVLPFKVDFPFQASHLLLQSSSPPPFRCLAVMFQLLTFRIRL